MQLSYRALDYLRQCLSSVGWNKSDSTDIKHQRFYISAKMLVETLPETPPAPLMPSEQVLRTDPVLAREKLRAVEEFYKGVSSEFTLSDKEFETTQACLHHFVNEDGMPKGRAAIELYETFKLAPK